MRVSSVRVELVKERGISYECPSKITSAAAAADLFSTRFGIADREHFEIIMLDAKNKPVGIHTVSIGSLSASIVHPREVFKAIIAANAAAFIAGHNHPSGDTTPSREDCDITSRLKECSELLGVRFLDHIIIGEDPYYSFADSGRM